MRASFHLSKSHKIQAKEKVLNKMDIRISIIIMCLSDQCSNPKYGHYHVIKWSHYGYMT